MAKINESLIVVKVSELVRDSEESHEMLDAETLVQLEAVIQELAGPNALVEIVKDNG